MNTKLKLLNCKANIYFNRTCLHLNLTPKYAQTRINSHNKTFVIYLEDKIHKLLLQNEIKFLYTKKQNLNRSLYPLD
jgi:adenylate cyclase class IV